MIDAKAVINGVVGLMATGGSTNHALHLEGGYPLRAAGGVDRIVDRFRRPVAAPSRCWRGSIPTARATALNQFQAAGGLAFLTRELLDAGLLHEDVLTAAGKGLRAYTAEPFLEDGKLVWKPAPAESLDPSMLRPVSDPFDREVGLRLLTGNLGFGR